MSRNIGRNNRLPNEHESGPNRPPEARERNTFDLPQGDAIRRELVRAAKIQREAALHWARTGSATRHGYELRTKVEGMGIPFDWPGWEAFGLGPRSLAKRMTPILGAIWDKAAKAFATLVDLDLPDQWAVVDPNTRKAIEDAALALSESTLATTSKDVETALRKTREALAAGVVESGDSVPELTKRLGAVFDRAETWRARRIAQTEASRAVHAGQEASAIKSGVVAGWRWLLSDDACPLCRTIARRAPVVRLGQPFARIDAPAAYAEVRFPPLHPHCNCTVVEVLDVDAAGVAWSPTLDHPQPEAQDEEPPDDERDDRDGDG